MKRAVAALGLLLGASSVLAVEKTATSRASHMCSNASDEVFVPAGRYQPFFKRADSRPVRVAAMCVSAAPVTHVQYLEFVRAHPEWRKSQVDKLFAEDQYLASWRDDLEPPAEALDAPVTSVSWFAAEAFCASRGSRLPTVAEWERIAGARSEAQPRAASGDAPFAFAMGQRSADLAHTSFRLAEIWEWTADFNSAVVAGRIGNSEGGDTSLYCGDGFRAVDPSNYAAFLRYSFRSSLRGDFTLRNLGFRCTRDAP
jgi:formylglycine-generating enzyme